MNQNRIRTALMSVSGLLLALACGAGGGSTELSANHSALVARALPGSPSSDADDDEGADDKVVCVVDADCDSDEVCTGGLCADPPGSVDDADDQDDEDEADDDGPGDKVSCAADADCDSDEVCGRNGRCTDPANHQNACGDDAHDEGDEDDEADDDGPGDKISCVVDADCDSDEVCAKGKCY